MKPLAFALLALALAGCGLVQALEGGGSTSTSSGSSTGGAAASGQGSNCGTDPETGVTLCLGNSVCPGLTIDTEVFPDCGFRVNGSAVDIECSCSGMICPLGASSCADAQAKLANSNYGVVCSQVSAGTCAQGTPTGTTSTSTSGGGGSCDTTCRDECAGEPTCIVACGC